MTLGSYIIDIKCTKCNRWADTSTILPIRKNFYVGCVKCQSTRHVAVTELLRPGHFWEYLIPTARPWLQTLYVKIKRMV